MPDIVDEVLDQLKQHNFTIFQFFFSLCSAPQRQDREDVKDFFANVEHILDAFRQHPVAANSVTAWIGRVTANLCAREVTHVASMASGLHFNALRATQEQLEGFKIEKIAASMKARAPCVWGLICTLLDSDEVAKTRRERCWDQQMTGGSNEAGEDEDEETGHGQNEAGEWFSDGDEEDVAEVVAKARERRARLMQIVSASIDFIMFPDCN